MPALHPPVLNRPSRGESVTTRERLGELLADLYARQMALLPGREYLQLHSVWPFIDDQVRTFEWYAPYLPETGAVLDWGCNHAPDSCMLRARFGTRYQLHGCDFKEPNFFTAFHQFAELNYTRLRDPQVLPYESGTFDAVIGAGVLEHAALEHEALTQLYRVLKPGGTLVIYYLPNRLSAHEWYRRTIRKQRFHRRLYGLGESVRMLKRCGFDPLEAGYHNWFWSRRLEGVFGPGTRTDAWALRLTRLIPMRLLCPTLRLVATKRLVM